MKTLFAYFMLNPLAQMIGFVALALALLSFQQNEHRKIMAFQCLATALFSVHFYMLDAPTAMALNVLSLIRNIIFYFKNHKWANNKIWLYFFIAVFVAAVFYTYEGPVSFCPLVGCIVFTISFWITDPKTVRRISWISSPMWIIYNIANNSWAGVITELFALSSIVIAMLRYDIKKKN